MRRPVLAFVLLLMLSSCAQPAAESASDQVTVPPLPGLTPSETSGPEPTPAATTRGRTASVRVVGERPHDTSAFTQGLEFDGGRLLESRGLYGQSAMTEIDPATGEVVTSTPLEEEFFGEGATVVGDQVIQITWREHTAFVYDAATLERTGTFDYTGEGEGWGICDLGPDTLWMSNGTSTLTERDPETFEARREVEVTLDGEPVERLNELECVDGLVWANVWRTDQIVVIDPADGRVVTEIDASAIATPNGRWAQDPGSADVLNGIAYDPATDTWLLTGKLWPAMYEVVFDCTDGCDEVALARNNYLRPDRFGYLASLDR